MNTEPSQLLNIAKAQKGILWCILAQLLCFFYPIAFLIVVPFQIYYVYKLAQGLENGPPLLWCIGMFIPIASLLLLLILSQQTTGRLQKAGFRVGLMGADLAEVRAQTEVAEQGIEGNN
ncbi:MAG: hypothetical protein ACYTGQ_01520 [Planctomycetota bacterium]